MTDNALSTMLMFSWTKTRTIHLHIPSRTNPHYCQHLRLSPLLATLSHALPFLTRISKLISYPQIVTFKPLTHRGPPLHNPHRPSKHTMDRSTVSSLRILRSRLTADRYLAARNAYTRCQTSDPTHLSIARRQYDRARAMLANDRAEVDERVEKGATKKKARKVRFAKGEKRDGGRGKEAYWRGHVEYVPGKWAVEMEERGEVCGGDRRGGNEKKVWSVWKIFWRVGSVMGWGWWVMRARA